MEEIMRSNGQEHGKDIFIEAGKRSDVSNKRAQGKVFWKK